jgi:hypothetical protein
MVAVALAVVSVGGCAARTGLDDSVFSERIRAYMELRKTAVDATEQLDDDEDAIELVKDRLELLREIQKRRGDAKQGDFLGGTVEARIRASLNNRFMSANGARLSQRILEVQPESFAVVVNERYPGAEPRSRMPADVLSALPKLPGDLSFRFVGRDLVLLDRSVGLILDVLPDALPSV